jgi:Fe-S-cluster-containing dehydrogenase component
MTKSVSRRDFLCSLAGCAAVASTVGCDNITHSKFFRSRFKELGQEDLDRILAEMAEENKAKFGKDTETTATGAQPGVEFGYALDLSRCTGCRRCVKACVDENNQGREEEIHWIRVLEMEEKHGIDFHHADPYYNHETVPNEGNFYLPVACQQCRNAPCVKSCPVGATWQEKDGIVVVDYDWCIGCRCCMAACPYGARRFNWTEPKIPAEDLNPNMHYLGNRPRPKGVVEKCTFCIQKTRKGEYPACVEICPVGSRKFGNMLDPSSEISYVLQNKKVFVLKAELNTRPRFYYFYG